MPRREEIYDEDADILDGLEKAASGRLPTTTRRKTVDGIKRSASDFVRQAEDRGFAPVTGGVNFGSDVKGGFEPIVAGSVAPGTLVQDEMGGDVGTVTEGDKGDGKVKVKKTDGREVVMDASAVKEKGASYDFGEEVYVGKPEETDSWSKPFIGTVVGRKTVSGAYTLMVEAPSGKVYDVLEERIGKSGKSATKVGAKQVTGKWLLKRDGKVLESFDTEMAAYDKLHEVCPSSWTHAIKHEGYAVEQEGEEKSAAKVKTAQDEPAIEKAPAPEQAVEDEPMKPEGEEEPAEEEEKPIELDSREEAPEERPGEFGNIYEQYLQDMLTQPDVAVTIVKKMLEEGKAKPEMIVRLDSILPPDGNMGKEWIQKNGMALLDEFIKLEGVKAHTLLAGMMPKKAREQEIDEPYPDEPFFKDEGDSSGSTCSECGKPTSDDEGDLCDDCAARSGIFEGMKEFGEDMERGGR